MLLRCQLLLAHCRTGPFSCCPLDSVSLARTCVSLSIAVPLPLPLPLPLLLACRHLLTCPLSVCSLPACLPACLSILLLCPPAARAPPHPLQVLNVVVAEMLQGHPVSEKKLKELLGHTPLQVRLIAELWCSVIQQSIHLCKCHGSCNSHSGTEQSTQTVHLESSCLHPFL